MTRHHALLSVYLPPGDQQAVEALVRYMVRCHPQPVSPSPPRRRSPIASAVAAGVAEGCYNLGVLYDDGHGVPENQPRAAELYRMACDGGVAEGCRESDR